MKKLVSSILFLFIASSLYAIDLSSLSVEQLERYNRECLFVDVGAVSELSATNGNYSATARRIWKPYMGSKEITKYEFLKITNHDDDAIKIKNAIASNEKYKTIGYVVTGISSALFFAGGIYGYTLISPNSNPSRGQIIAASSMITAGFIGVLLSYLIPLKYKQIDVDGMFNVNLAINVADVYNLQLLKRIAGNAQ